ncbi:MAG: tetratricopeptide repeat protein [Acidobacteriota bacterium]
MRREAPLSGTACRAPAPPAGAVALLLALLAASAAPVSAIPGEQEAWIRVDTANFTLFSNASRRPTLEVGRRMELFRRVLARLNPDLEVNSPLPTYVFVFRDDRSFAPYRTRSGAGPGAQSAYFAADRDANYVALNAAPEGDPSAAVYHEFVHYFLNNNFSDIPVWLNEGLAEYYTTLRVSGARVEIGRPLEEYADWLRRHRMLPLPDLLAVTTRSREYNEEKRQGAFYAQSWALVHYLIWGDPDWNSDLAGRLARLVAGDSLITLLHVPTLAALEEDLRSYVEGGRYRYGRVEFGDLEVDEAVRVTPIARAEALYRLGDLLARIDSGKEKEARRHLREAIRLDPSHAAAYAGLGFLLDREGRHRRASGLYEKALALDGDDYLTCFLYATNLSRRHSGDADRLAPVVAETPPLLARARELYRRSIRLRPGIAEAYAGLGATYLFDGGGVSEGIEALETARRMLPDRPGIVFHLLQLYARIGERDRARALLGVLSRRADDETVPLAREAVLQADLAAAEALLREGRHREGMRMLERVRAATRDPDLEASLASEIRELRSKLDDLQRVRETNRHIALYNEAIARANRGEHAAAIELLRRVIREAKDAGLRSMARDLLPDLEEASRRSGPPRH